MPVSPPAVITNLSSPTPRVPNPQNSPHRTHLSRRVACAAPSEAKAPMNKQTAIPLNPSVEWCSLGCASFASSGLLPGSSTVNTTVEMPVATNCGSVVYRFRMPRYTPASSPLGHWCLMRVMMLLLLLLLMMMTPVCLALCVCVTMPCLARWARWGLVGRCRLCCCGVCWTWVVC